MTVDWTGYQPYTPHADAPHSHLSRRDAEAEFDNLVSEKRVRIEMLKYLSAANGVELQKTDDGIRALNEWFRCNVESSGESDGRLRSMWYSVVDDISLFLGDVIVERSPHLRWEMLTAQSSNIAYQKHVLVGFLKPKAPDYNVDIDRLVATHAYQIVQGKVTATDDYFLTIVRLSGERA